MKSDTPSSVGAKETRNQTFTKVPVVPTVRINSPNSTSTDVNSQDLFDVTVAAYFVCIGGDLFRADVSVNQARFLTAYDLLLRLYYLGVPPPTILSLVVFALSLNRRIEEKWNEEADGPLEGTCRTSAPTSTGAANDCPDKNGGPIACKGGSSGAPKHQNVSDSCGGSAEARRNGGRGLEGHFSKCSDSVVGWVDPPSPSSVSTCTTPQWGSGSSGAPQWSTVINGTISQPNHGTRPPVFVDFLNATRTGAESQWSPGSFRSRGALSDLGGSSMFVGNEPDREPDRAHSPHLRTASFHWRSDFPPQSAERLHCRFELSRPKAPSRDSLFLWTDPYESNRSQCRRLGLSFFRNSFDFLWRFIPYLYLSYVYLEDDVLARYPRDEQWGISSIQAFPSHRSFQVVPRRQYPFVKVSRSIDWTEGRLASQNVRACSGSRAMMHMPQRRRPADAVPGSNFVLRSLLHPIFGGISEAALHGLESFADLHSHAQGAIGREPEQFCLGCLASAVAADRDCLAGADYDGSDEAPLAECFGTEKRAMAAQPMFEHLRELAEGARRKYGKPDSLLRNCNANIVSLLRVLSFRLCVAPSEWFDQLSAVSGRCPELIVQRCMELADSMHF